MDIQHLNIELKYKPGRFNVTADALSRLNKIQIKINACQLDTSINWSTEQNKDVTLRELIARVNQNVNYGVTNKATEKYKQIFDNLQAINNVLYLCNKNYRRVIVPEHMRTEVLSNYHEPALYGHLSTDKTWGRVKSRFYWPSMRRETDEFCKSCEKCQLMKNTTFKKNASLVQMGFQELFEMIGIDVVGPLPQTGKGNKYIIVAIDYGSKWCEAKAVHDFTALTTAKFLVDQLICRFGIPSKILSDQGRNFESKLIDELCKSLKIKKLRSSPYHPACNGEVERQNKSLKSMLSCYVNNNHNNWDQFLQPVVFAYNTAIHGTTGISPFEMVFGKQERSISDISFSSKTNPIYENQNDYLEGLEINRRSCRDLAQKQSETRRKYQKHHYDKKANESTTYEIGDKVKLHNTVTAVGQTPKFSAHWTGPYEITKINEPVDYVIKNLSNGKLSTVHYNRLRPWNSRNDTTTTTPTKTPTTIKTNTTTAENNASLNYSSLLTYLLTPIINNNVTEPQFPPPAQTANNGRNIEIEIPMSVERQTPPQHQNNSMALVPYFNPRQDINILTPLIPPPVVPPNWALIG
jgi:hypothetical protein